MPDWTLLGLCLIIGVTNITALCFEWKDRRRGGDDD